MDDHSYEGDLNDFYEDIDQDDYIKKIEKHLSDGGGIDVIINEKNPDYASGSILIHSVYMGFEKIVKYTLNKGACITNTMRLGYLDTDIDEYRNRMWNVLEIAIMNYSSSSVENQSVYEIIKEMSIKNFSSYGLHPIHLECAIGNWSNVERIILADPTIINKTIDEESPLWAGVTPLLIAAKFNRREVLTKLLDIGASSRARDCRGNTPLHFSTSYDFYDRRLFIFGDEDTFGGLTGTSHFHIACQFCPDTMDVVKAYLDEGASPNLPARENDNCGMYMYEKGDTGLHIAGCVAKDDFYCCPDLALLLLQYGADVHLKNDDNETALKQCIYLFYSDIDEDVKRYVDFVCLLIEVGASSEDLTNSSKFVNDIINHLSATLCFVSCVKRIIDLRPSSVSSNLLNCYQSLITEATGYFNETAYGELCKRELSSLSQSGLYPELFYNTHIGRDFNLKFGSLIDSSDISRLYPLYSNLLMIRLKRKRIEYEKKKRRLGEALPFIIRLFLGIGNLPVTCAEEILWNLNFEELGSFIKIFNNNYTLT